jgi:glycosyltransferase involved in cell wall biosynthesis
MKPSKKSSMNRFIEPLVSILIPTYNRADYLGEAIDSALKQTYKNIEIVVHDDASTDSTPQLLMKYSDKRLRIIRTEDNHGMLGGWNYIVTKAKGEYIKILASDDLLEPKCVEELVKAAIINPNASVITCQRKFIDGQGRVVKKMGFANKDTVVDGHEHARWILTTLRENKIGEPTAVLYPTKLVKKAGDYDKTFSQFADFEYWIRLLEFGDLVYVHKSLCSFRTHAGSNTSAAILDGRFITEIFALLNKYYTDRNFVKAFNLSDKDRDHVTKMKTLDTLKNIKDLFVHGELSQARRYFTRLSAEVSLDSMTRSTISFLLQK